jgi:hypothetical protein
MSNDSMGAIAWLTVLFRVRLDELKLGFSGGLAATDYPKFTSPPILATAELSIRSTKHPQGKEIFLG